MESDYAVNLIGKFAFFISVLPPNVSLIRNDFSEFPDDDIQLYKSHLNMEKQIETNYSKKIMESYLIFKDYTKFMN